MAYRKIDEINMLHSFPEVAFGDDYIIATYQLNIQTSDIEKMALAIADEQTTGTWIKVKAETSDKKKRFGAKVVSIYEVPDTGFDYNSDVPPCHIVQVAFPIENMGTSLPMMLSTLFGNISASGQVKMIDCAFPKKFLEKFSGPKFGIEGVRDVLGVKDRPLLNAMIKPNIGWTPEEGAELFYAAAKGGVDVIKDDELLPVDEPYCPLEKRVKLFMEKERQVYEETGEHTLYATNITGHIGKLKENAYRALEYGTNCLMLNVYTSGLGALQMLVDDPNINVPVLAHVDFASAYSTSTYTGISQPLLVGKFTRIAGADFQIAGHPYGKFPLSDKVFQRTFKAYTQPLWNIKPMMPAYSGGTTQLIVSKLIEKFGTDIIVAAGGGVHGHPDGSEAGAKSMRQAIDAACKDIPVVEYAKSHRELAKMIDLLGVDVTSNFDLMK